MAMTWMMEGEEEGERRERVGGADLEDENKGKVEMGNLKGKSLVVSGEQKRGP